MTFLFNNLRLKNDNAKIFSGIKDNGELKHMGLKIFSKMFFLTRSRPLDIFADSLITSD